MKTFSQVELIRAIDATLDDLHDMPLAGFSNEISSIVKILNQLVNDQEEPAMDQSDLERSAYLLCVNVMRVIQVYSIQDQTLSDSLSHTLRLVNEYRAKRVKLENKYNALDKYPWEDKQ